MVKRVIADIVYSGLVRGYPHKFCWFGARQPEGVVLTYQYENPPLAYAMKTMHMHCGTAVLMISNGNYLAGDYYAGRDRRTFGRICCRRLSTTHSF